MWSWVKDHDHIEKAFDFAGMGARNGVMAVSMVQAGLTGVDDVLDGTHNKFIATLSTKPQPEEMVALASLDQVLCHRDRDRDEQVNIPSSLFASTPR